MSKNLSFRTDMADERVDEYKKVNNLSAIDGIEVISNTKDGVITTIVNVLNENGSKALSKEVGKYITIEVSDAKYLDEKEEKAVVSTIAEILKELVGNNKDESILVVGLGNVYVTPDALGPKVVENVEITRHLINFAKELVEEGTRSISAISPGVLGTTGIETSEIINAVTKNVKPSLLIVIDSLASSSMHRVGNTIQISNTGITPGAGVRNKREGINIHTIGVPVIAIGVPTVVDMATITNEAIDKMLDSAKTTEEEFSTNINSKDIINMLDNLKKEDRYNMIANILDTENYIVTPKEVDDLITTMSRLISSGINEAI